MSQLEGTVLVTDDLDWDLSTDVVVVGAGVAGMAAAIEAKDNGSEVIVLDRYQGGGASTISGGIYYAGGGTAIQKAAGIEDTPEEMFKYLQTEVGDAVSDETLRKFCEGSSDSVEWLMSLGVPFSAELCPFKTSYPNDDYFLYYSGSEATGRALEVAKPAPRGHRARGKGTSGKKMYEPMEDSALRRGVLLKRFTRVSRMLVDGQGSIRGVEAITMDQAPAHIRKLYNQLSSVSRKPGVYAPPLRHLMQSRLKKLEKRHGSVLRVEATQGVVLAGGGFYSNRKMVQEFAPQFKGGLPLGTAGDDGAVINFGRGLGGAVSKMHKISAWRFITPASAILGTLFVGRSGKRTVDESRYGAAIGESMVLDHDGKGWLLADAKIVAEAREQLKYQPQWFQRIQAESMMRLDAHEGATVAEVARSAGIDVQALEETVRVHNDAIDNGEEDPFKKTDAFRTKIDTAPFHLFEVSVTPTTQRAIDTNPCPMISLGGLVVDEHTSEVLTDEGTAIAGLYAVGRSAVGICSNGYVSGLSLADCVFSGRRAGAHIAARS